MKHFIRTLTIASAIILVLSSCTDVPGTQAWKIKKAATVYIKQELKDGEDMHWGNIQQKNHRKIKGKVCTYVEVKYTVASDKGNTYKTLYLLLSENCDSIYSASDKSDKQQIRHYQMNYKK